MSNRTIEQNLTLLSSTKRDIRNAINIKGGSVSSATPFADYATAINNLPSGLTRHITSSWRATATGELSTSRLGWMYILPLARRAKRLI